MCVCVTKIQLTCCIACKYVRVGVLLRTFVVLKAATLRRPLTRRIVRLANVDGWQTDSAKRRIQIKVQVEFNDICVW